MGVGAVGLVIAGAVLAAAGQVFLKLGAVGAHSIVDYLNIRLVFGFALYGIGAIFWVIALTHLPLSKVYPYTVLTFVIVYIASFSLLGEEITIGVLIGALLVIAGLLVITIS